LHLSFTPHSFILPAFASTSLLIVVRLDKSARPSDDFAHLLRVFALKPLFDLNPATIRSNSVSFAFWGEAARRERRNEQEPEAKVIFALIADRSADAGYVWRAGREGAEPVAIDRSEPVGQHHNHQEEEKEEDDRRLDGGCERTEHPERRFIDNHNEEEEIEEKRCG
jgi:hypothetical protein